MSVITADLAAPAMACLRVSIFGAPAGHQVDDLQALVGKLINAFLESRWVWPRQFEQMTAYAFVLTDPSAGRMDKRALKALAAELQLKLFGAEGDGEVSLLMFEGSDVEVHRFARLSTEDVERMLCGEALNPPFEGSLECITPDRLGDAPARRAIPACELAETPAAGPGAVFGDLAVDTPERPAPPRRPASLEPVYGALYLTGPQSFAGSIALCRRPRRDRSLLPDLGSSEPLPGVAPEVFDLGCVHAAVRALEAQAAGLMFVPLCFSSLVRPGGRRLYARFLCQLPVEHRDRLGAAVYDAPRAPSFFALSAIRRFLDPFFGEINLHVRDPAFEVERLPPDIVTSVTLVLPDLPAAERQAAIRRFMSKRDAYRKKRVWPGVGPLLSRAELEACLALKVPVVGGPAVAPLGPRPLPVKGVAATALPSG